MRFKDYLLVYLLVAEAINYVDRIRGAEIHFLLCEAEKVKDQRRHWKYVVSGIKFAVYLKLYYPRIIETEWKV